MRADHLADGPKIIASRLLILICVRVIPFWHGRMWHVVRMQPQDCQKWGRFAATRRFTRQKLFKVVHNEPRIVAKYLACEIANAACQG